MVQNTVKFSDAIKRAFRNAILFQLIQKRPGPGKLGCLDPSFRVTRPYLNLLVKPRIFQVFWKNKILCILKGEMPFKIHKKNFFPEKTIIEKNVCLPKIFRSVNQNTLTFLFCPFKILYHKMDKFL